MLINDSTDFTISYCYGVEMTGVMERHVAGEACVIPIILRSVIWEEEPFSELLALPRDGKAVTLWKNQDEAFTNIAGGIRKVVEDLNQT